jgi:anion-transporting  ArsA/GET3 family ATPase
VTGKPRGGDWPKVRLHVVSGKGGTGKTTVAAALALALASGGGRVLLMEVEGRQGIAQLFDTPPLPYEERLVAVAPDGGEVFALAVDPEAALLEYLEMFYNMRRAGTALRKLGAVDFATTIAPGVRDVLLTGKAIEAVKRGERAGKPTYDAIVMDAPPTGRITRFLNVTSEVGGLAKVGPIKSQSDSVMAVIRSPRTAVHLVTLLEEMPVQETLDGIEELRESQLPVGAVIVNMERGPRLTPEGLRDALDGTLDVDEVKAGVVAAELPRKLNVNTVTKTLIAEAAEHAERVELEQTERERLDAAERPIYELPEMSGGIDLGALYAMARMLREQGVA